MVTNYPIVHSELYQEKMTNSNRIGIKTILSTSMNVRESVFGIEKMVMLIIILENLCFYRKFWSKE